MPTLNPTPNLNGTSREELVELRLAARDALLSAMKALGEMRPHGRDYLGNGEAYQRDLSIHNDRVRAIDGIVNDLFDEALSLHNNA
jgi:hypothetical protein